MHKISVHVRAEVYYIACLCIVLLPLKFLLYWFISVLVHEGFHFMTILLSGGKIYRVNIGASGVKMDTAPMSDKQEIICAAAGPLGGIVLFALAIRHLPVLAILSLVHSVYNLIPLFPLDGGRMLRKFIQIIWKGRGQKIITIWTDRVISAVLICLALYCTFHLSLGVIPILIALSLIFKNKKVKCS